MEEVAHVDVRPIWFFWRANRAPPQFFVCDVKSLMETRGRRSFRIFTKLRLFTSNATCASFFGLRGSTEKVWQICGAVIAPETFYFNSGKRDSLRRAESVSEAISKPPRDPKSRAACLRIGGRSNFSAIIKGVQIDLIQRASRRSTADESGAGTRGSTSPVGDAAMGSLWGHRQPSYEQGSELCPKTSTTIFSNRLKTR